MKRQRNLLAAAIALAGASLPGFGATSLPPPPAPSVVDRFSPGGDTGWDLLAYDTASHRLFVSRSTHVQVLDGSSGKLIGDIAGTDGVHGIALAPESKKGFTSNGKSNSVTEFDFATLKVLKQIPVNGNKPDTIIYDPASRHVFVFNGASNNASVIDPATDTVIATVDFPGNPELAAADGQGHVYVNIEDKGQVAAIDSLHNKLLASWSLGDCQQPSGLALDAAHQRTFSTCKNKKLVVLDVTTGKAVTSVPIGEHPDGAAFDAATGLVYSPNGEGTLTVIKEVDPDHYLVIATVPTQNSARTIVLDPATHRLFLPAAEHGPTPPATPDQPHPPPGHRARQLPHPGRTLMPRPLAATDAPAKVPAVTLGFWVIKIAATTLGETGGDTLSMSMNLGYLLSTAIFAVLFVIAVLAQVRAKRFHPVLYWVTIVATTTVGTTMADFADRSLGIGYTGGSLLLLGLLAISLLTWYRTLGTVAIDTVQSPRAEIIYWVTIMFSQTLGTALGDWTADSADLGYGGSALLFGALLGLVAACYFLTSLSRTLLFWAAFILTRPLGAVVGDFLDKPVDHGGLALSRFAASASLLAFMAICIAAFPQKAAQRRD